MPSRSPADDDRPTDSIEPIGPVVLDLADLSLERRVGRTAFERYRQIEMARLAEESEPSADPGEVAARLRRRVVKATVVTSAAAAMLAASPVAADAGYETEAFAPSSPSTPSSPPSYGPPSVSSPRPQSRPSPSPAPSTSPRPQSRPSPSPSASPSPSSSSAPTSSPRPQSRPSPSPSSAPTSSPRPQARPSSDSDSSPRPQARPTAPQVSTQAPTAPAAPSADPSPTVSRDRDRDRDRDQNDGPSSPPRTAPAPPAQPTPDTSPAPVTNPAPPTVVSDGPVAPPAPEPDGAPSPSIPATDSAPTVDRAPPSAPSPSPGADTDGSSTDDDTAPEADAAPEVDAASEIDSAPEVDTTAPAVPTVDSSGPDAPPTPETDPAPAIDGGDEHAPTVDTSTPPALESPAGPDAAPVVEAAPHRAPVVDTTGPTAPEADAPPVVGGGPQADEATGDGTGSEPTASDTSDDPVIDRSPPSPPVAPANTDRAPTVETTPQAAPVVNSVAPTPPVAPETEPGPGIEVPSQDDEPPTVAAPAPLAPPVDAAAPAPPLVDTTPPAPPTVFWPEFGLPVPPPSADGPGVLGPIEPWPTTAPPGTAPVAPVPPVPDTRPSSGRGLPAVGETSDRIDAALDAARGSLAYLSGGSYLDGTYSMEVALQDGLRVPVDVTFATGPDGGVTVSVSAASAIGGTVDVAPVTFGADALIGFDSEVRLSPASLAQLRSGQLSAEEALTAPGTTVTLGEIDGYRAGARGQAPIASPVPGTTVSVGASQQRTDGEVVVYQTNSLGETLVFTGDDAATLLSLEAGLGVGPVEAGVRGNYGTNSLVLRGVDSTGRDVTITSSGWELTAQGYARYDGGPAGEASVASPAIGVSVDHPVHYDYADGTRVSQVQLRGGSTATVTSRPDGSIVIAGDVITDDEGFTYIGRSASDPQRVNHTVDEEYLQTMWSASLDDTTSVPSYLVYELNRYDYVPEPDRHQWLLDHPDALGLMIRSPSLLDAPGPTLPLTAAEGAMAQ